MFKTVENFTKVRESAHPINKDKRKKIKYITKHRNFKKQQTLAGWLLFG
jgi:DNA-binding cell septation regulator SpoVG